jgi:hypothetical protein
MALPPRTPGEAFLGGAEGDVELVSVRFTEDKNIDVPH